MASPSSWWRHQMETFFVLLALCKGNPPVTSGFPLQSLWRGALMISLICTWTNSWANNRDAGDLRRHCAHYGAAVMTASLFPFDDVIMPYQSSVASLILVPIACSAPSHYLNQFWRILKWGHTKIDIFKMHDKFCHENAFHISICKMSAVLFRSQNINISRLCT